MKAKQFYDRKRAAGKRVKNCTIFAAFFMYLQVPTTNIITGDVYYRQQLSFHSFIIHLLSNNEAYFYTYDETIAKKGADDGTFLLNHFFYGIYAGGGA